jgi:hypothetical protein
MPPKTTLKRLGLRFMLPIAASTAAYWGEPGGMLTGSRTARYTLTAQCFFLPWFLGNWQVIGSQATDILAWRTSPSVKMAIIPLGEFMFPDFLAFYRSRSLKKYRKCFDCS